MNAQAYDLITFTLADKGLLAFLVLCVFILLLARFKTKVLDFAVALALATAISELIKYLSNVPRPLATFEGSSFPSTHTALAFCSFAFYLLVCHTFPFLKNRAGDRIVKLGLGEGVVSILLFLLALIVAFSRIVLGAHTIYDIIAGIILGVGSALPFVFYDVSGRRTR